MKKKRPPRRSPRVRAAAGKGVAAPPKPKARPAADTAPIAIVGVGASAGGLAALESFLKGMPADTGAAFVVVTHQHPDYANLLPELLRRHTTMPVFEAKDGQALAANVVYLSRAGTCHTCVFYAEPTAAVRALPVLEKVVRNYRSVQRVQMHMWPSDVLRRPQLAARAISCAEISEVVALTAAGRAGVCPELIEWFRLWEQHSHRIQGRLLVLLHPRSPDRLPVPHAFRFLSDCAMRTGAGLIWRKLPDELPRISQGTPAAVAS